MEISLDVTGSRRAHGGTADVAAAGGLGAAPIRHRPQSAAQRCCRGGTMSEMLTAAGYEQTKEKLRELESRLAEVEKRTDLDPAHLASVRRSYRMMMREYLREYLREIKLYEARQSKRESTAG